MELRHLRYFVTVAEERNVSRAAARLHVSQPAISRQLKDLEQELGAVLFERERSGIRLTEAGQTFLAHARDILRRAQKAVEAMGRWNAAGGVAAAVLRVGYIATAMASFLGDALARLSERHPAMILELRELAPQDQVEQLRAGKLDVGFVGSACGELRGEFEIGEVRQVPLCAVLPAEGNIRRHRKTIAFKELADKPFVGLNPRLFPGRNDMVCQLCQAEGGFTPQFVVNADSLATVLALVGARRGVAILPDDVRSLGHGNTVMLRLKGSGAAANVASSAIWRAGYTSLLLTELLEDVCQGRPGKH